MLDIFNQQLSGLLHSPMRQFAKPAPLLSLHFYPLQAPCPTPGAKMAHSPSSKQSTWRTATFQVGGKALLAH